MSRDAYERLVDEILQAIQEPTQNYSAVEMVDRLSQRGKYNRDTVRATVLDLIDRGKVVITSDLRLSTPSRALANDR